MFFTILKPNNRHKTLERDIETNMAFKTARSSLATLLHASYQLRFFSTPCQTAVAVAPGSSVLPESAEPCLRGEGGVD